MHSSLYIAELILKISYPKFFALLYKGLLNSDSDILFIIIIDLHKDLFNIFPFSSYIS